MGKRESGVSWGQVHVEKLVMGAAKSEVPAAPPRGHKVQAAGRHFPKGTMALIPVKRQTGVPLRRSAACEAEAGSCETTI